MVNITIIDTDEDGDPVEIAYQVPAGYEGELILKGGSEWYRFPIPPNPGTARMGEGELLCDDAPASCQPPGEDYVRCPSSPCLNQTGTKFEADDDFESFETTQPLCPGES